MSQQSARGVWRSLVTDDQVGRVTNGFIECIAASMMADKARQTRDEIQRRFDLCATIFCELRGDLKWPVTRILDAMPKYLRCRLDGAPYNAEEDGRRGTWTTSVDPLQRALQEMGITPEPLDERDVLLVDPGGAPAVLK